MAAHQKLQNYIREWLGLSDLPAGEPSRQQVKLEQDAGWDLLRKPAMMRPRASPMWRPFAATDWKR